MGLVARIPGVRQVPQAVGPILRDVVLFDSWRGQYSDNPRAISEELHRRGEPLRHVWVLDPGLAGEVPDWVEPVATGSTRHLAMMGRARYLVANSTVLGFHRKRRGTTFMQTWHGAPLKKIGFDIPRDGSRASRQTVRALHRNVARRAARQAVHTLRRNVENWDLLLSPDRFATPIFRKAFGYQGPIVESGYPRNDLLVAPHRDDIRAATRERLGVAERQRAVLYAPTYRDDASFALDDEVERLAQTLGDSHVVLLRKHKADAPVAAPRAASFRDVSLYPDNRELFLAADVLVTDYSSVMFDFALTGKPMLFYTYDLDRYRDELRGFYFDFEAEAPGPLLFTVDDLVSAIHDVGSVPGRYASRYRRFVEHFCSLEDGRASERAVEALLAHAR